MTHQSASRHVIRRVVETEWRNLRDLRLRALRTDPLAFGSTLALEERFDDARWQERAAQGARSRRSAQWVVQDGTGCLVGTAVVAEVEGAVKVFAMWVEPESRGRGLGGKLLDAGLAWAAQRFPRRPIRLEVNRRQAAAVHLYLSRGFRFHGVVRPLGHTVGEQVEEMIRDPR